MLIHLKKKHLRYYSIKSSSGKSINTIVSNEKRCMAYKTVERLKEHNNTGYVKP